MLQEHELEDEDVVQIIKKVWTQSDFQKPTALPACDTRGCLSRGLLDRTPVTRFLFR